MCLLRKVRLAEATHHFDGAIGSVVYQLVLALQACRRVVPLDSEAIAGVRATLREKHTHPVPAHRNGETWQTGCGLLPRLR